MVGLINVSDGCLSEQSEVARCYSRCDENEYHDDEHDNTRQTNEADKIKRNIFEGNRSTVIQM